MKAIRVRATVDRERRLVVDLPEEISEGPVELIFLSSEATERPRGNTLAEHVEYVKTLFPRRSRAEIDTALEAERASWG